MYSDFIKKLKFEDKPVIFLLIFSLLVIPSYITGPLISDFFLSMSALLFIYVLIRGNLKNYINNRISLFFVIFFTYIIINSFFSIKPEISLKSSFFYFRFYLFALALSYLLSNKTIYKNYLYIILYITLSFVVLDTFFQYIFGQDIFGYKEEQHRLSGPFGDELIVGGFISKILPLLLSIYFYINKKISLNLIILVFLSFIVTFLSGERVSFFNILTFLIIFLWFYEFKNKKKILIFIIFFITFLISIILKLDDTRFDRMVRFPVCAMNIDFPNFLKCEEKMNTEIYKNTFSTKRIILFSEAHEGHFKSGIKMFKDNPIFGKGIKMFRYHCSDEKFINKHSCTTHPHNTLVQILAELGLLGFIFLSVAIYFCYRNFFKLVFLKIHNIPNNHKLSFILANFSLIQVFFIFLPSGQFFNNYLSILYYLPLGIFLNLYYKYIDVR